MANRDVCRGLLGNAEYTSSGFYSATYGIRVRGHSVTQDRNADVKP